MQKPSYLRERLGISAFLIALTNMFISGTGGTGKHAKQCSLLEELSLKSILCSTDFLKALRELSRYESAFGLLWSAVLQALTNTKQ